MKKVFVSVNTLLILFVLCNTTVLSQASPFSQIYLSVGSSIPLDGFNFQPYWRQEFPNVHVAATTPFYLGEIKMGAEYVEFESKAEEVPAFKQLKLVLGWGKGFIIANKLRITGGFKLINQTFFYEKTDQTIQPELGNDLGSESELGLGLESGMRWQLTEKWELWGGLSRDIIFTHKKIVSTSFTLNVRYMLPNSSWLQKLFAYE